MAVHSRFLFATRGLIPSAEAVFLRNCGGGKKKRAEANESKKQASRHSRLNYITAVFKRRTIPDKRGPEETPVGTDEVWMCDRAAPERVRSRPR